MFRQVVARIRRGRRTFWSFRPRTDTLYLLVIATTMSQTPLQFCAPAASTTTGRLHGVLCITRTSDTVSEPASSRLPPTWSPPTSLFIVIAAACAAVPAHDRLSTLLSSRCIIPTELTRPYHLTFNHLHSYLFPSTPKTFLFRHPFPILYCDSTTPLWTS